MTARQEPATPCRQNLLRSRWECITWPDKPTAYPCAHDHSHCDAMGCVEHVDGMHVDGRGDVIVHIVCVLCKGQQEPADTTATERGTDG